MLKVFANIFSPMQLNWILHFFLSLTLITVTNCNNENCFHTEFCICISNGARNTYECGKADNTTLALEGFRVELFFDSNLIKINCFETHTFSEEKIPSINFTSAYNLEYNNCPLPLSNNFNNILNKFLVKEIKIIKYLAWKKNSVIYLMKNLFKNLTSLKNLNLESNNIKNLEIDSFDYVPNLTILNLSKNKMQNLKADQFKSLVNLIRLDLRENQFRQLPDNIFANLTKLEKLQLTKNCLIEFNPILGLQNLTSLVTIELQNNQISNISENTFENMLELSRVFLSNNPLRKLPNTLFKNNKRLTKLVLSNCSLEQSIPENIFSSLINLNELKLDENLLKTLPDLVFKQLSELTELHLNKNQLENISINLFQGLTNLKILNLENNLLKLIEQQVFNRLLHLQTLKLSHNKIYFIDPLTFSKNLNLRKIEVSYNNFSGDVAPLLSGQHYLEIINFSHNQIVNIDSMSKMSSLQSLRKLDLSFNNIETIGMTIFQSIGSYGADINLEHNSIATINFQDGPIQNSKISNSATISLSNNPLACDCSNYYFLQFLQEQSYTKFDKMFNMNLEDVVCTQQKNGQNILFKNLSLIDMVCDPSHLMSSQHVRNLSCPNKCNCTIRPQNKSYIINCLNNGFSTYPAIQFSPNPIINQIELHLELNNFTSGPSNFENQEYYSSVTHLYLSHNYIKNITSMPAKLQLLQLNNNLLERLDDEFLEYLNNSRISNLTLDGNPWICECNKTENFAQYLRNHAKQVIATSRIFCANTDTSIINLNKHSLCKEWQLIIIIIVAIMPVLLFCALTVAVYYGYKQEIKRWLFSKQLCLWWVTEEEVDNEKLYDAFISYSHKDENFVTQELLPVLESGPVSYKVCVHFRDWVPGEFISTQITNSIAESRRTIIILSSNFVESDWGKNEFRKAHTQAMTEGRARVIVMLYGDIDIESLDEELKAYLNANTYIKWGDSYFWDKLRFALPHHKPNKNSQKSSQKCTNLISCFDDRYLVRTSVSSKNTTYSIAETPTGIIEQSKRYSSSVTIHLFREM